MNDEVYDRESSSLVLPVLISGAIGAGLALLLAPKSGKEIRSDITKLARKGGQQASETAEEAKAAVSRAVETVQPVVSESGEQLSESFSGDRARPLVLPILISGVVGAAVALLFAPKPGSEVVTDIKDMASSALEKSKGWYEQGAAAVKDAMEKGKEATVEAREKLKPAA